MTYCANLWPHIFNVGHDYFAWFTAKSKPCLPYAGSSSQVSISNRFSQLSSDWLLLINRWFLAGRWVRLCSRSQSYVPETIASLTLPGSKRGKSSLKPNVYKNLNPELLAHKDYLYIHWHHCFRLCVIWPSITVTAQLLVKYKSRFSVFDVAAKPELIPCPHYLNYKVGIY